MGRQDRARRVELFAEIPRAAPSVEYIEGFRRTPSKASALINKVIRALKAPVRNLRRREGCCMHPARPPTARLSSPHSIVGAHEENARQCDSGRRVARRFS